MPKRTKKETEADRKLIRRVRDRYKVMSEADQENRELALEDLRFVNVPGEQWDDNMTQNRGDRPCYEFNKLRPAGKRVINEIRANRPAGKVRAVEGGDKNTAELYEGLIRNIWNISDGDTVVDHAAEYLVDAGMAAWQIDTEYSSDSAFDQDIIVRAIKNPFCLFSDPSSQDFLKRDADDWILTEKISKASFEERYPDANPVSFDDVIFEDEDDWKSEEQVRIALYDYKEPAEKDLWLFTVPDGEGSKQIVVDSESDEGQALAEQGVQPERTRLVKYHKIMRVIISGDAVLEQPVELAGSQHRYVQVHGEYKVVDGKSLWWGLHRFSKDAQRSYNVSRTAIDETIAGAPRAKWWATPEQAEGLTNQWATAHEQNRPFMLYNPDPSTGGAPPQRMGGADVPVALMQQAVIASDDIRDTSGLHEASFGEESGEKSGIALARKQSQAQIVTYNFPDNMAKGIRRTWEILIDLIPEIYDAEREIRILGSDGTESYETINQFVEDENGDTIRINDMSAGKYDVTITTGPSFSTLRQEAAEVYGQIAGQNPELMQVAGDLVFKSLDFPYAEDIAERWQAILPPQIQQLINSDSEIPPEVQQMMQQAEMAMQQVQEQGQLVQAAAAEVEEEKNVAEKTKLEIQVALADMEAKKTAFEAEITKKLAELTLKKADQTAEGLGETREGLSNELNQAMAEIQKLVAEFMQASVQTLAEIQGKNQPQVVFAPTPKVTKLRAKRENGELVAIPEYENVTQ